MFKIEHCIWQNFINLNVYKRASGVKCKGAKIPDYELNITITAPSLLTSYFINLNWNWMKKIPYWIFFKFALRGKRVGVVFFQLRMRETDANREYFTPWLTTKLPNDPPTLRAIVSLVSPETGSDAISGSPGTFYGRSGNTRYIK